MPEIVNHNEWRIIGLSRSGNHAVINWLLAHLDGRYCFLNCVEPKYNPFECARPLGSGDLYQVNYDGFELRAEQQGMHSRKDYLLYSYEDCFLGLLRHRPSEAWHDAWVGPSKARRDLLILRDPFNLFASRIHFGLDQIPHHRALGIWKQHAREALGIRRYLPASRLCISYNRWVTSEQYRREIADQLGLHFTDAAIDEVPTTAGGSSFDGLTHRGNASEMKVLDRWREFANDEDFWRLFDEETIRLSTELFGPPPTESEFSPLQSEGEALES